MGLDIAGEYRVNDRVPNPSPEVCFQILSNDLNAVREQLTQPYLKISIIAGLVDRLKNLKSFHARQPSDTANRLHTKNQLANELAYLIIYADSLTDEIKKLNEKFGPTTPCNTQEKEVAQRKMQPNRVFLNRLPRDLLQRQINPFLKITDWAKASTVHRSWTATFYSQPLPCKLMFLSRGSDPLVLRLPSGVPVSLGEFNKARALAVNDSTVSFWKSKRLETVPSRLGQIIMDKVQKKAETRNNDGPADSNSHLTKRPR